MTKNEDDKTPKGTWKELVANAYIKVPQTIRELAWRTGIAIFTVITGLTGIFVYRNPSALLGKPLAEQSLIERMAADPKVKHSIFELMQQFFYSNRPHGLMLVSWEELDALVGVWVKPANKFPGKSGAHHLTPDMRILSGPFVFGECKDVQSLAMPGMIMVACPINSEYDVWGYVAAIVAPEDAASVEGLVRFLAHRIVQIVY